MGITGKLETMELAELLQWLSQAQKTGTLIVARAAVEKRIYFRDGRIISSSSSDPREYLGNFLVARGHITAEVLERAVAAQRSSNTLIGKLLVQLGALSEETLYEMLQLKAEESIFELFAWSDGDFRFLDRELPAHDMVPIALDVQALVLEGVHRLDEWKRIRASLPNFAAVPVALVDLLSHAASPAERLVLAAIDDRRTVSELCASLPAGDFFVCRLLLREREAGRIKVISPRGEARPAEPAAPESSGSEAKRLLDTAAAKMRAGEFDLAARYLRAARALDPENKKLETASLKIEDEIRLALGRAGIRPEVLPQLTRPLEALMNAPLTPFEGFLVSRIDGRSNVQALTRILPLSPLESQLVLWRLMRAGHLRLQAAPPQG